MNNIKLAFRNMKKNGSYTWINVLGLTLAFTLCLFIFSVVIEENSYDKSWSKYDRIYRIVTADSTAGIEDIIPQAYANLGTEWKKNFPEIQAESSFRTGKVYLNSFGAQNEAIETSSITADEDVFDVLDIHLLQGNPFPLIKGKKNLIITRDFKDQHFKDQDVIGKSILSASPFSSKKEEFIITAVIDNLPYNSVFRTSVIQINPKSTTALNQEGWGYYQEQYLVMKAGTDINSFTKKANDWYRNFLNDGIDPKFSFHLQPLSNIYMEPLGISEISGNKKASLIFQGIAVLVLIISCINYINLYAVRTIKKVKSINLFKVLGASRSSLIRTLLIETGIIFITSLIISLLCYFILLNPLESFLGYELVFARDLFGIISFTALGLAILLAFLIGIYPAWIVSNVKSSEALKNKLSKSSKTEIWTKRSLIITQFCISLVVIVGLITIKSQVSFMQSTPLGLNVENLLSIKTFTSANGPSFIKNEISKISGVENVSVSGWTPGIGSGYLAKNIEDKQNPDQQIQVSFIGGDTDLVSTLGISLLKGRNLTETDYNGYPKEDAEQEVVLNALVTESTAKRLGITELGRLYKGLDIIPVGIIEDFHSESFHKKMVPTVITPIKFESYGNILVKIKPGQEKQVAVSVNNVMKQHAPEKYLNYDWIDEVYSKSYQKETKQAQLFTFFSVLALFISALGVTGLILQSVEQRIKEIGIRKVLGATISNISNLFAKEYVLMIIVSIVIACPIAWYLANKWLEDFAYKIEVQWWFFGLSGLIIFVITLITVNIQTIRAAMINPVERLKEE